MKLYQILNCTSTSTYAEIESNYKKLIKETHPLRSRTETERYYEINRAYEVLKDKYKREFYDLYGERTVSILQNSQEGFVISRVFFKNNLLAFILLSLICLSSLLFLPLYIYLYKDSPNVSYFLYIIPFFIATCLFVVPIRKSYKLIGKMILQLYKMVIASGNGIIIGTELVIICLYADRIVNGFIGSIAVLLLELVSICFNFYSRRRLIELDGTQVDYKVRISDLFKEPLVTLKMFIRQMVWSSSLLIVFFNWIPMYIKASAAFSGIYFYLLSLEAPFIAKIVICSPLVFYSTTFYLAVTGFKSCFIFFPLMLLTIAIVGGACVAYSYLPKIKMKYRELPFEELV